VRQKRLIPIIFLLSSLLGGCQPENQLNHSALAQIETATVTAVPSTPIPISQSTIPSPIFQPFTPTPVPTSTGSPTPLPTTTPLPSPTATPIGPCDQRLPQDDLLTFVTLEYGLNRDYKPSDLVPLSDYFPTPITLGYPTEVRKIIIGPLANMIGAMQAIGLQPLIISGYRSYSSQTIAWEKWNEDYPDSAAIVSAPPGHSEHQLGTTIDFGSPELPEVVGEDIEFHTYFYKTSEGIWLLENAHEFGFTLSYSREAFDVTGFYYEPWHFRYVGVELAKELYEEGKSLAQYLLETQPLPCIP
jgi:D-alanyl-D-alanine carboxypeptidase